ncbi:MAG: AAA family ATPase [Betaproteobacteria bacterium HGW-Betaproteobacteria-13]|uniref:AAA family ATPase n=1 Tax=Parazoarcus communis TaxID=41977 RepID=A0A2U8H8Y2_9RHOO|nr:AAA family ATPase [Parazoarcus communis]AWI82050.1 AAA family ATPase [Parazoarcus communis]PKO57559.1 MAG: AAA family ATPase [Betaproteobacteria bacterium HGW-Betaproteobacteria-19]PKO79116.1 MAG: AAA family ATPase [Betaproteobacteria bacterium HGW-Betaproteobacteria-13]
MPQRHATRLLEAASQIILGKEHELQLALSCLIARGHLLIEDMPGVGKTTLAHVLARLVGLHFQRIQFTSDLLPADIVGVSVFDRETSSFRFNAGPVFAQLILADEINRATPKTQSALLEAMEERQITADGATLPLPDPFFVIATQNPSTQIGTFPLPESQLDRFLMRIRLGYPDRAAERALLMGEARRELIERQQPVITPDDLIELQDAAQALQVADRLIDYVQNLLAATRQSNEFAGGLSPRAGLGLLASARAWALIEGRDHVLPEDVQRMFPHVAGHRLHLAGDGRPPAPAALDRLLHSVPVS